MKQKLQFRLLLTFSAVLLFINQKVSAQGMINDGATITITAGANVIIDGDALGRYTNQTLAGVDGKIDLNGSMYVEGNWINNATGNNVFINHTAAPWGTVYLSGAVATTIGGTRLTEFENLNIQNANRTLLITNCEVNNNLTVSNAALILNQNKFIIDNGSAASITQVGTGNVRSESTAAPFGEIQWNIGNATGSNYVIPFGTAASALIPFTFSPIAGTTGNLIAATYPTNVANVPYPPGVLSVMNLYTGLDNSLTTVDRFWELVVPGSLTSANVNFRCTAAEAAGIPNPRAQRWSQPMLQWEFPLQGAQSTQVTGTNVTGMITTNSWWTLADITTPLPVNLIYFNAGCIDNKKELAWSTASEIECKSFVVEKSYNAYEFSKLIEISGSGNSSSQNNYKFNDDSEVSEIVYYRLKQIDFNGTENIISSIKKLEPCQHKEVFSVSVISNYSTPQLLINSEMECEVIVAVSDLNGQIISKEKVLINKGHNLISPDTNNLSFGVYSVQVINSFETVVRKILITGSK